MARQQIYAKVLEKNGRNYQLNMVMEECAELIQAVNKYQRDSSFGNYVHLCSEIADVEIMIEQMKGMFFGADKLVAQQKRLKICRLKKRLI